MKVFSTFSSNGGLSLGRRSYRLKKKGSTFISEMEKLQMADSETGLFQQTWKTLTEGMTQETTSLK